MKTGFIGLGRMGIKMATNLIKAGNEVKVYNRTPDKARSFSTMGAKIAKNVAEACKSDVIITMLSDDKAVENISFGKSGIIENMPRDSVHISMSTISIAMCEKLTTEHKIARQHFVSAPVFGRPEAAEAAKLFIIAGGEKPIIDKCMPLFEAMGQKTFNISEKPVDANYIKLTGNFLIATVIESLGEAIAMVRKAGIDQNKYLEILTSTLFSAPVYNTYGKQIIDKNFTPAGFAAPLGQKDIGLIISAAENLKVPMPIASLLHDRFLALIAQQGENVDWSAIGQLALNDSGQ